MTEEAVNVEWYLHQDGTVSSSWKKADNISPHRRQHMPSPTPPGTRMSKGNELTLFFHRQGHQSIFLRAQVS